MARMEGEYRSCDDRYFELAMIDETASSITARLTLGGRAFGIYSLSPSLCAKISAPGMTSPSATINPASLVASASRTPEDARTC